MAQNKGFYHGILCQYIMYFDDTHLSISLTILLPFPKVPLPFSYIWFSHILKEMWWLSLWVWLSCEKLFKRVVVNCRHSWLKHQYLLPLLWTTGSDRLCFHFSLILGILQLPQWFIQWLITQIIYHLISLCLYCFCSLLHCWFLFSLHFNLIRYKNIFTFLCSVEIDLWY